MSPFPSREEALFSDALAPPPAERRACVDCECGGNVLRRDRIHSLLAGHQEAESLPWPGPLGFHFNPQSPP